MTNAGININKPLDAGSIGWPSPGGRDLEPGKPQAWHR